MKIRRQTDKNWEQKDKKKQRCFDPEGSKSFEICVQPATNNSNMTHTKDTRYSAVPSMVGRMDNRAVKELSFAHVTTKIWAYSRVFGFIRKIFGEKTFPPHPTQITF